MRDYILLHINGREHKVRGADAFLPLTDYLRYELGACGTKVVCAEGDCGACTVAIGRAPEAADTAGNGQDARGLVYKPINGCIQYVFQLDCAHVITVEGVRNSAELHPVQASMVDCHGAQCGYCTPGFVMMLCSMYSECASGKSSFECGGAGDGAVGQTNSGANGGTVANNSGANGAARNGWAPERRVDRAVVKEALSGNLCRCTGYTSIVQSALAVDETKIHSFNEQYPAGEMLTSFAEHRKEPVQISAEGRVVAVAASVEDAVAFKGSHEKTVIVSGGTDVCVNMNKRSFEPPHLLSLANIQGLDQIDVREGKLIVGAKATLRDLEQVVKRLIPEFYKVMFVFGSPQIRYAGTLAGNIANGSPIADSLPFLYIMGAEVEVCGTKGSRTIKIDSFYKSYKVLALEPDEIIVRVHVPIPHPDEIVRLYKVSRREHLDISSFTAAIRMKNLDGVIRDPVIAYGGVGPLIIRLRETEKFLAAKPFTLETFTDAGQIAKKEITPISDVRGSKDFRFQLAENILLKFFHEHAEKEVLCLS